MRAGRSARIAVALAAAIVAAVVPAAAKEISGDRSYAGEIVVPQGDAWTVLPGAVLRFRGGRWTVRGTVRIEGTASRPVRIVGDDAFEGLDIRGERGGVIADAVFSGGTRAVQLTGAGVVFRRVRFQRNGIGVEVGPYANAAFDNCTFDAPSRVGVLVKRGGTATFSGSRFSGAGKAGIFVYGARGVQVRESRFESNETGLAAAMPGADVSVSRSVFRGNKTGIVAERMADPRIEGCDVAENGVGLLFSRRAEGRVSGTRIAGNREGVVVEFSSYPVFRGNRFGVNREAAVRLRNQSSRWEEEWGDATRELAEGGPFGAAPEARSGSGAPGERAVPPRGGAAGPGTPPGRRGELTGTVDFRGNDWGELAREIAKGGAVPEIHDGRIEADFEYRGKRYPMDRVLLK